jgi:hypothetical protein
MPFPTVSFCPYIEKALDDKPLGSFIQECWHNLDRDCQYNPENYFESFRTHRGVCYRFNSGKNMSGHSIPIHNSTVGGRDGIDFFKFIAIYLILNYQFIF